MNIQLSPLSKKSANLLLPLFEKETVSRSFLKYLSKKDRDFLFLFLKKEKMRMDQVCMLLLPGSGRRVIIFGKGQKKQWSRHKTRILLRKTVQSMKAFHVKDATILLESIEQVSEKERPAFLELIASEYMIADYIFNTYKKEPKGGWPTIHKIEIAADVAPKEKQILSRSVASGVIIGEETNHTRHLANTPGGDMTPHVLAEEARRAAKKTGLKVTILETPQIKKLSMGGVLGVSRGSSEKPKFIILEHKPKKYSGAPLVLIGKGVTFDTGGLNLKPSQAINEMHMDMSGGAAVIHALAAIARLDIPLHVFGLIPAVENMPSGSSYRPGDILRSITGKTIEVLNTDAEGRIILADALGYAARYKPRLVVDIATLTGAALVALGQRVSALFTKEKELEQLFRSLGETSGDYLWPLPLWDEYAEDIKGTFGDIANLGKPEYAGGAIMGAVFLKEFTSYPWAHIDMAPTMTAIESDKLSKGAKGTGVRLFVALARHLAETSQK